jgi:hypothetical protein
MLKIFVIVFILFAVIILFLTKKIILIKKSVYYKYIDKTKKLSNFDYIMDYDGNWLLKKIDFDSLYNENKDEYILGAKLKIKKFETICISILLTLFLLAIVAKVFKIIP